MDRYTVLLYTTFRDGLHFWTGSGEQGHPLGWAKFTQNIDMLSQILILLNLICSVFTKYFTNIFPLILTTMLLFRVPERCAIQCAFPPLYFYLLLEWRCVLRMVWYTVCPSYLHIFKRWYHLLLYATKRVFRMVHYNIWFAFLFLHVKRWYPLLLTAS